MKTLPDRIYMIAQWWPLPSHRGDRCRLHIAGAYYSHEFARMECQRMNADSRSCARNLKADGTIANPLYVISYKMRDHQSGADFGHGAGI